MVNCGIFYQKDSVIDSFRLMSACLPMDSKTVFCALFQILCPWFLSEWIDGIVAFTHFLLDIHLFAHGLLLLRFQLIRAILVSECSLLISLAASQFRAKSEERLLFSNLDRKSVV